jgi:magnesium-transporting ATPase (P-type)
MLIIATSDKKGWCYIETKNLDGETNKKIKMAEKKEMFRRVGYNHEKVNLFI